jgi:hypothetical protein
MGGRIPMRWRQRRPLITPEAQNRDAVRGSASFPFELPWMLAVTLGLAGCSGVLGGAISQFEGGQYPAAKRDFASLEASEARWSAPRRAQYALYRGLTLGALGDEAQAAVWLEKAAAIEAAHPGALSVMDAQRLHLVAAALSEESR